MTIRGYKRDNSADLQRIRAAQQGPQKALRRRSLMGQEPNIELRGNPVTLHDESQDAFVSTMAQAALSSTGSPAAALLVTTLLATQGLPRAALSATPALVPAQPQPEAPAASWAGGRRSLTSTVRMCSDGPNSVTMDGANDTVIAGPDNYDIINEDGGHTTVELQRGAFAELGYNATALPHAGTLATLFHFDAVTATITSNSEKPLNSTDDMFYVALFLQNNTQDLPELATQRSLQGLDQAPSLATKGITAGISVYLDGENVRCVQARLPHALVQTLPSEQVVSVDPQTIACAFPDLRNNVPSLIAPCADDGADAASPSLAMGSGQAGSAHGSNRGAIVGGVLGGLVGAGTLVAGAYVYRQRNRGPAHAGDQAVELVVGPSSSDPVHQTVGP